MLKIAALVLLLLAGMALEAAGAEGSSGIPMQVIDAGEILAKVKAGQPVEYDHVVVRGDLDLSRERLKKNITSLIRINDSVFEGLVNVNSSILEMPVELSGSNFTRDVYFGGADFSGYANFEEANFGGYANFKEANFGGYANFVGAAFSGSSSFEDAEFNRNIEFGDTRFENQTSFYRILFKRPAYFENCSIKSLNLTKAEYSRLHLRWDDIKSLHFDEAAYLALIKNYNTLGWYGDANWCYYDYRNAVRNWMAASSPGFAARLSNLLDWLIDYVEWILYGYGVRPSFPIAWSVMIILAFRLFFWQKRCLRKLIVEEK
ncbi:MAG: pentapeptide repeat-containing protein, partial [Methanothrix sp.]